MNQSGSIIIGASSALGWAIAKSLNEQGEAVRLFVRNRQKASGIFADFQNVEFIEGDAFSQKDLDNAVKGSSNIFYCINVPYPRWKSDLKKMLSITLNAALRHNAKIIFPGNVYVYGHAKSNPVNEDHPFAAHTRKGKIRIEMEKMLSDASLASGLKYSIIRMPDFYGPYVINGLYEKIFINSLKGEKIQWYGSLDIPTEFIYIEDAGKAMVQAGVSEKSLGKVFNVPGCHVTTTRAFLNEIACQGKKGSRINALNSEFIVALGGLFNPIAREFREMMYLKKETFLLDGSRYRSAFGSIPSTPYREGIKKTLEWAKEYFNITQSVLSLKDEHKDPNPRH
ncbi:MAG: NAD-dependent epimerase/dehydratase family protein [Bacillota bacterium]